LSTEEDQDSYYTWIDYDPDDPESIRRAYEVVFGLPQALGGQSLEERAKAHGLRMKRVRIEKDAVSVPDYDLNDPESIKRAHEKCFGLSEALRKLTHGAWFCSTKKQR